MNLIATNTKLLQRVVLMLAGLASLTGIALSQDTFALRDGDRVVFYGDSITDQRRYTSFVETFVITRFPNLDIRFVHSGWGGDRVTGGGGGPIDVRLWRDVLPYDPTVVTIMLGMNDGRYRAFDQEIFETYATGYQHIIDTLKRQLPGVRITAIQPSPYDDVTRDPRFEGGYNEVLIKYGEFLSELAAREQLGLADLNTPLVQVLDKANASDPDSAARLIADRIHPGQQIALVMAEALLQSWNAPTIVTEVEIDAARKTVNAEVNTEVSHLSGENSLAWTQMDRSLPMPISSENRLMALVLESSDFTDALNRQPLRVKSLAPGSYRLLIDGEDIGRFNAEELSSGINLAEMATPMMRQAENVNNLTLQRTAIHNARWRQLQVPLQKNQSPELLNALGALDELEATLQHDQRAAAQPKMRKFELRLE